jgi:hypothetical protein
LNKDVVVYEGFEINIKDKELVNLTRAWKAIGSPDNKDPRQWKRKGGREFIETLSKKLNVPSEHIYTTVRGKRGGTYAHWQIFLAYAKYLSPDFHIWANQVVKERFEEIVDPDLIGSCATETASGRGCLSGQGSGHPDGKTHP